MKVGQMFPGKYMKAADLGGEDLPVLIDHCSEEMVGQGADAKKKPVLHFDDQDQALVLNVTNANVISAMYGDETDNWSGKKIVLYPTKTQMGAQVVDCIRVRLVERKRETPVIADEGSRNEPF